MCRPHVSCGHVMLEETRWCLLLLLRCSVLISGHRLYCGTHTAGGAVAVVEVWGEDSDRREDSLSNSVNECACLHLASELDWHIVLVSSGSSNSASIMPYAVRMDLISCSSCCSVAWISIPFLLSVAINVRGAGNECDPENQASFWWRSHRLISSWPLSLSLFLFQRHAMTHTIFDRRPFAHPLLLLTLSNLQSNLSLFFITIYNMFATLL